MNADQEFAAINPAIREVTVGIRKLRKIHIYPLSMADQLEFTKIIMSSVVDIFVKQKEGLNNIEFAGMIQAIISENLGKLLAYITDDGEKLLKELSNEQAMDIAEIVFDVNYGVLETKARPFVEKIKKMFLPQQEKSSPPSSGVILNTDLKISSAEASETEG